MKIKPNKEIGVKIRPIAEGFASTSVNATIFRYHSVISKNHIQIVSFYNPEGKVLLAKRELNTENWEIFTTEFGGNVRDAHNVISLGMDKEHYIHVSWDHHGDPINLARSKRPYDIKIKTKNTISDIKEKKLTYPEFYIDEQETLFFFYRKGKSGSGDLMLYKYENQLKKWQLIQKSFISGRNYTILSKIFPFLFKTCNPYWQIALDGEKNIHITWVWRDNGDASTNHDLCYARSPDGGNSWYRSTGARYTLPIRPNNAEYILSIPTNSNLANTGTMYVSKTGIPFIATYWQSPNESVPNYKIVFKHKDKWRWDSLNTNSTPFDLKGKGELKIPICRPRILIDNKDNIFVITRERSNQDKVVLNHIHMNDLLANGDRTNKWRRYDLTLNGLRDWEPTCDMNLWKRSNILHLFIQNVKQGDHGVRLNTDPTMAGILECDVNEFIL